MGSFSLPATRQPATRASIAFVCLKCLDQFMLTEVTLVYDKIIGKLNMQVQNLSESFRMHLQSILRDCEATLRWGGGTVSDSILGGTRHFFLLTL